MKWLKVLKAVVKVGSVVADVAVKNPQNAILRDKAKDAVIGVIDSLEDKLEAGSEAKKQKKEEAK
jgi:adenosine/AMP kinase